jgi:hypothetical protein
LTTVDGVPKGNDISRLQRRARERADSQARRIPWQRLLEARNQYIDWQEFYFWVRSIVEVEDQIPDWLVEVINERCPGFLESEHRLDPSKAAEKPVYLRLEDWIDEHIFGFAKQEGWFNAVTFYAVREPRYQRAQICWSESVEQWKQVCPVYYPSFGEWKLAAAQCDDAAHLVPDARAGRESAKRVDPRELAEAVERYLDWEAFAYWVRPALERSDELSAEMANELERRCPGFLEAFRSARTSGPTLTADSWPELMRWIAEHCFQKAKAEGWCDAILSAAQIHPRAIRTQEYCDHCDEIWAAGLPVPYPSFEQWRQQADGYVEEADSTSS